MFTVSIIYIRAHVIFQFLKYLPYNTVMNERTYFTVQNSKNSMETSGPIGNII